VGAQELGERAEGEAPSDTPALVALYHHISSKEVLLYDICKLSLRKITDDILALAPDEDVTVERLHSLIAAHVNRALKERDLHATMLTEFRELSPAHRREVVNLRAAYEELWRKQLAAGQAKGLIRSDIDARYLTLSLLNLLNWTIFWYEPTGALSSSELAEIFFQLYMNGAHGGVPDPH
jgi:AcrR family transcriptional regulator